MSIAEEERNEDEKKDSTVCKIASELISLSGNDEANLNSKTIAIQVASELIRRRDIIEPNSIEEETLLDVLETSVYDKNKYIQNTGHEYIYYLSLVNPDAVIDILDRLFDNMKGIRCLPSIANSLNAALTISLLLYCDNFEASIDGDAKAQELINHLQRMWKKAIERAKHILPVMLWLVRVVSKFIVQRKVGTADPLNIMELKHFYKAYNEKEQNVIVELTPYFKLENGDLSSVSDTIVGLSRRSDIISFIYVMLLLSVHASVGNIKDVSEIAGRMYKEGSEFTKGFGEWALGMIMDVNNDFSEVYIDLVRDFLDEPANWWFKSEINMEYCPHNLCGLLTQYRNAGFDDGHRILEKHLELAGNDESLLYCVVDNMRALAIYAGIPTMAISAFKQVIENCKLSPNIREHIKKCLADIRIYYPDYIDELLQSVGDNLTSVEKGFIRSEKSSELIGHLLGERICRGFLPQAMSKSPKLRNEFANAFAIAPECKNVGKWIDQIARRTVNLIMGEEFMKVISVD